MVILEVVSGFYLLLDYSYSQKDSKDESSALLPYKRQDGC